MIENFDKKNLAALRAEIEAALKVIADRNGITLALKNISYDPIAATFRAPIEGKAGGAAQRAQEQAVSYARQFLNIDASEPSTHPQRIGAVLVEFNGKARNKAWVFEWKGQRYVAPDATASQMWPKIAVEDPGLSKAG